jgi:hypothetical protein
MSSNSLPPADPAAMCPASPPIATPPSAIPMAITSPSAISSALSSASRSYHLPSGLYAPSAAVAIGGAQQYHAAPSLGSPFPATAPPAFPVTAHMPGAGFSGLQQPHAPFAAVPIPIHGATMSPPPPLPPPRFIQELSAGRDMGWTFGNPSLASSADSSMGGALMSGTSPYQGPVSTMPPTDNLPRVPRGIKVAARHVLKRDGGDHGRPRKRRSLGTPLGAEAAVVVDGGSDERNGWRLSLPG